MVDFDEIMKDRAWHKETDIGRAFALYENKTATAWVHDTEGRVSNKRLRELWDTQKAARKALLLLIRRW